MVAGQSIRRDQCGRGQRELGVVAWKRTSRDQRGHWTLKEGRMLRTQIGEVKLREKYQTNITERWKEILFHALKL